MSLSLNFDEGIQEIPVNGNPNRIIRFNPGDMNILKRYNEVVEALSNLEVPEIEKEENDQKAAEMFVDFIDSTLKDKFNYLFNADVYDTLFQGQSPLDIVGNGQMLCEAVINAVGSMVSEACGQNVKKINMKMDKYTSKYAPQDHKKASK